MAEPELERLAEEIWAVTTDLFRFLRFHDRDTITACGLSVAQCYAVGTVGLQGNLTLNEFADALFIAPSTATRLTDGLVRKGLLTRTEDPADRRAVRLGLTPKGEAVHRALRQHFVERQRAILQQIDPGSRRGVLTALQKLYQAIRDPSCCSISFDWKPDDEVATRALGPRGRTRRGAKESLVPRRHAPARETRARGRSRVLARSSRRSGRTEVPTK